MIKILEGSVVTQNHLSWANYVSPVTDCQQYMCQKVWKLAESWQVMLWKVRFLSTMYTIQSIL